MAGALEPLAVVTLLVVLPACGFAPDPCAPSDSRPGGARTCPVPGVTDRAFDR